MSPTDFGWLILLFPLVGSVVIGLGFRVILVKDACGSGSAAMHQTAILNLANRLYGGAVTDTEGACRLMAGDMIEAWRVQGSIPLRFTYENAADLYHEL